MYHVLLNKKPDISNCVSSLLPALLWHPPTPPPPANKPCNQISPFIARVLWYSNIVCIYFLPLSIVGSVNLHGVWKADPESSADSLYYETTQLHYISL